MNTADTLLLEISWEVCNQQGGIYTVIRSKLPAVKRLWGDEYCLIGPYLDSKVKAEIDIISDPTDVLYQATEKMKAMGYDILYGHWLVTGKPKVILINPDRVFNKLDNIKKELFEAYKIHSENVEKLVDETLMFAEVVKVFLSILCQPSLIGNRQVISHAHEWMAVGGNLLAKAEGIKFKSVFTTHATILGRYLAMNESNFYERLGEFDWKKESKRFGIQTQTELEHFGGKHSDVFTTVSELTGKECEVLLKVKPNVVTPNGINIDRFAAFHEVHKWHHEFKTKIHRFTVGHFFQNHTFDLSKTLYFFTSGRYEYKNKGFDITLKALKKLNLMMIENDIDITVVFFLITKKPTWSINPNVLESRGVLEEISHDCEEITKQIEEKLFFTAASSNKNEGLPDLNSLVPDYWKLRYRRTLQAWRSNQWPLIVTHNLKDDVNDEILNHLRRDNMLNSPLDKVKFVYHPDFISSSNPLFGIDYDDFVRGCHLGIFPSYYEPWGYTPMECIARGVPTVTSDLSGFGNYVIKNHDEGLEEIGVNVLKSDENTTESAENDLAKLLFNFVKTSKRARMDMRNKLEDFAENFDWKQLVKFYQQAYLQALAS
jgi:glycogen synthase